MLKVICVGAAILGLFSATALANGFDRQGRIRAAKQGKTVDEVIYRHARIPARVVPPCFEINPVLLKCLPIPTLYPYEPSVLVLRKSLVVRQQTPYPKLSVWPHYY